MLKKIRTLYSYVLKTTFNNVYFGKVLNESRFSFQDWVTDSETFKMTGFNPLSDLPSAEEAGEFVRVNKLKWLRSHNESSIDKRLRLRHYTVTKSLTLSGWLKKPARTEATLSSCSACTWDNYPISTISYGRIRLRFTTNVRLSLSLKQKGEIRI